MENEFQLPLPEWERRAPEIKIPPREFSSPKQPVKKEKSSRLKTALLTTAAAVAVVTAAPQSPGYTGPAAWEYLENQPVAYYARSPEEAEARIEQELWYEIFGTLGDYVGPCYGMFGKGTEPTDAFRKAVSVQPELHENSYLGLPCYTFTVDLPEGQGKDGKDFFESTVSLLESPADVVFSYGDWDSERDICDDTNVTYVILHGQDSFERDGMTFLAFPYIGRAYWCHVFGNGASIVGQFDMDGDWLKHVTTEHSCNAGEVELSYLLIDDGTTLYHQLIQKQ